MNKSLFITRGGQVFFHNLRMFTQVNKSIGHWMCILALVCFLLLCWCTLSYNVMTGMYYYGLARFWLGFYQINHVILVNYHGQRMPIRAQDLVQQAYFMNIKQQFWSSIIKNVLWTVGIIVVVTAVTMRWFAKRGQNASEDQYLRGAKLVSIAEANRFIKHKSVFTLDNLHFQQDFERQHILYHGTTGAGKSVAMLKQLLQIREYHQKVALSDISGAFLSKLYRSGDVILNPFDSRSVYWDMWEDCEDEESLYRLASYLIPQHPKAEPIWVNAPRQIFVTTAQKLRDDPERSQTKLLMVMLTLPLKEYAKYFEGTDVASLTDERIEKTVLSIRAVLASYLRPLRFLDNIPDTAPRFSLMAWLRNDTDKRWLFMTVQESHLASMRGLLTAWTGFLANGILTLTEDTTKQRAIWLCIDEFSSLYKIAGFADALSKVRKFSGHFMLGMQSYPQLVKNYGKDEADEIIDLLNTQLFFRSNQERVARFASIQLGEQEIEYVTQNYSYGANSVRDGISFGKQIVKRAVVLPSEIQSLDNLCCYVTQGGAIPSVKIELSLDEIKALMTLIDSFMLQPKANQNKKLETLIQSLHVHADKAHEPSPNEMMNLNDVDETIFGMRSIS